MKAMMSVEAGGPETLRLLDMPEPVAGPGQVLISVAACGLNYPDVLVIRDLYQRKLERPFAPGLEIAGTIRAVGAGVEALAPGQRVAAWLDHGGLAEMVAVDADRCTTIPDDMPFDQAAGFLVVYGTSYYALKTCAALQAGETLLVLGAAGGVGLAAVELGAAMGARVVAAAKPSDKVALARNNGAAEGLVYARDGFDRPASKAFTSQVLHHSAGDGVDVIYDPVGGAYAEAALRGIAWQGRYLVVGFTAGIPSLPMNLALLKGCKIIGVLWGAFLRRNRGEGEALMGELFTLYREGRIRPTVSATFALEDAAAAMDRLASRQATGKVVVTMGQG